MRTRSADLRRATAETDVVAKRRMAATTAQPVTNANMPRVVNWPPSDS